MKVKEESETLGLKLSIQKTKIMTYGPMTSWQIDVETVADFIFLGSKITADGDCSHEIKQRLLLGRKAMTNLDSMLKSRDITLPTKVRIVKVMIFPMVMYGCESWTIKKAEQRRIDDFELWCWRRLLRVPWALRRSNQSILKEINLEYLLEGLMVKLKLQNFGHLMLRTDSFEKTLMLGKTEGGKRRERQSMRWLDGITDSMKVNLSSSRSWWWTGKPGVPQSIGSQRVVHDWATELSSRPILSNTVSMRHVWLYSSLEVLLTVKHIRLQMVWKENMQNISRTILYSLHVDSIILGMHRVRLNALSKLIFSISPYCS